jgi:hypothetical protein
MSPGPGYALCAALLAGPLTAGIVEAACLAITANPGGERFLALPLPSDVPAFTLTYVHSVTRTPVEERYRVEGDAIVETEIRFEQHGPGLPTEPDAGGQWRRSDGKYVVTTSRRFTRVVMRIDAATRPTLVTPARTVNLAQWGNRALALEAEPGPCV